MKKKLLHSAVSSRRVSKKIREKKLEVPKLPRSLLQLMFQMQGPLFHWMQVRAIGPLYQALPKQASLGGSVV